MECRKTCKIVHIIRQTLRPGGITLCFLFSFHLGVKSSGLAGKTKLLQWFEDTEFESRISTFWFFEFKRPAGGRGKGVELYFCKVLTSQASNLASTPVLTLFVFALFSAPSPQERHVRCSVHHVWRVWGVVLPGSIEPKTAHPFVISVRFRAFCFIFEIVGYHAPRMFRREKSAMLDTLYTHKGMSKSYVALEMAGRGHHYACTCGAILSSFLSSLFNIVSLPLLKHNNQRLN